jgi:hypothetical protein
MGVTLFQLLTNKRIFDNGRDKRKSCMSNNDFVAFTEDPYKYVQSKNIQIKEQVLDLVINTTKIEINERLTLEQIK